MSNLVPEEAIGQRIFLIRGHKVMVDIDLAKLYGVKTKVLNQAVRRNIGRFPDDFMFILSESEKNELVTNCDQFKTQKHSYSLPYVFTEQGVAMLSTVLNSERAIQVNIAIMRAFVKLRQILSTHKELAQKFTELEGRVDQHDKTITAIFDAIKQLMMPPDKPKKKMGFVVD